MAEGLSNRQIAERMFISQHTVHAHLSRILTKRGLTSRVQIATLAAAQGVGGSSGTHAAFEEPEKLQPPAERAPELSIGRDPS